VPILGFDVNPLELQVLSLVSRVTESTPAPAVTGQPALAAGARTPAIAGPQALAPETRG
jgi:hypothetical protein